jgi:hypothetical protein
MDSWAEHQPSIYRVKPLKSLSSLTKFIFLSKKQRRQDPQTSFKSFGEEYLYREQATRMEQRFTKRIKGIMPDGSTKKEVIFLFQAMHTTRQRARGIVYICKWQQFSYDTLDNEEFPFEHPTIGPCASVFWHNESGTVMSLLHLGNASLLTTILVKNVLHELTSHREGSHEHTWGHWVQLS